MDGGEVLELCLKAIGVDHLTLAWLVWELLQNQVLHIALYFHHFVELFGAPAHTFLQIAEILLGMTSAI